MVVLTLSASAKRDESPGGGDWRGSSRGSSDELRDLKAVECGPLKRSEEDTNVAKKGHTQAVAFTSVVLEMIQRIAKLGAI
jgi:hypothetical protein